MAVSVSRSHWKPAEIWSLYPE
uniref:SP110 nuclear body protein variant 11 n=2 Tax=Sus scrofa TaxID=9823 RepID=S5AFM1_PIG|nr:SP110 nuclear body protein variant 3 [Sus scrofa]AGP75618.1 SP110 nuclear body protein variant 7 [Sus scrofa]AGP75622.1 SP110 nuclear body protein variant 11 [Sus scrofa]AGP75626.1 SP110 nuclear body protein variant 15 [Sus scrofa]